MRALLITLRIWWETAERLNQSSFNYLISFRYYVNCQQILFINIVKLALEYSIKFTQCCITWRHFVSLEKYLLQPKRLDRLFGVRCHTVIKSKTKILCRYVHHTTANIHYRHIIIYTDLNKIWYPLFYVYTCITSKYLRQVNYCAIYRSLQTMVVRYWALVLLYITIL